MKKSNAQVNAMIAALREIKPKVREKSAFGDNHHDAIDAQIEVLEEGLDQDEVDNRRIYEDNPDEGEWEENVADEASAAIEWRDDDGDDLIEIWKELVVK